MIDITKEMLKALTHWQKIPHCDVEYKVDFKDHKLKVRPLKGDRIKLTISQMDTYIQEMQNLHNIIEQIETNKELQELLEEVMNELSSNN